MVPSSWHYSRHWVEEPKTPREAVGVEVQTVVVVMDAAAPCRDDKIPVGQVQSALDGDQDVGHEDVEEEDRLPCVVVVGA